MRRFAVATAAMLTLVLGGATATLARGAGSSAQYLVSAKSGHERVKEINDRLDRSPPTLKVHAQVTSTSTLIGLTQAQLRGTATPGNAMIRCTARGVTEYKNLFVKAFELPPLDSTDGSVLRQVFELGADGSGSLKKCPASPSLAPSKLFPLRSNRFAVTSHMGFPDTLMWRKVSRLRVSFRQGVRGKAPVPDVNRLTLEVHGNKDDIKAVFDVLHEARQGNPVQGGLEVALLDAGLKPVLTIELSDLTLIDYSPVPSAGSNTLGVAVTLDPSRIAIR